MAVLPDSFRVMHFPNTISCHVVELFGLTSEEIAIVEESAKYCYGEVSRRSVPEQDPRPSSWQVRIRYLCRFPC